MNRILNFISDLQNCYQHLSDKFYKIFFFSDLIEKQKEFSVENKSYSKSIEKVIEKTKVEESNKKVIVRNSNSKQKPVKTFYPEVINWRKKNIEELNSFASIEDILILNNTEKITYNKLLNCFQWRAKRLEILFRDKYSCTICNRVDKNNAVHHKYYIVQKFPWEYSNDALETLCHNCHKNLHKNTIIPIYRKQGSKLYETTKEIERCTRCFGVGYFSEYSHVEGGVCFKCRDNNLNYSTFFKRIELFYKYSHLYVDKNSRLKYERMINRFSYSDIFSNVPFLIEYANLNISFENNTSVYKRKIDYDDDLPF